MTEEKGAYYINGVEFRVNELAGILVARMVEEFKAMPDVWQKLGQVKQGEVLSRLRDFAEEYVVQAVTTIASDDRPTLQATLDQVVVKDGLKAVLHMPKNSEDRHELIDAQGKDVLVVVVDHQQYTQGTSKVKPEKDQKELDMGSVV